MSARGHTGSRRGPAGAALGAALVLACSEPDGAPEAEAGPVAADSTSVTSTDASPDSTGDADDGSTGVAPDTSSTGVPDDPPPPEPWVWDLPPGFPEPYVPADNPMSAAKVELGRHLFYDTRLSADGTYACATCHRQELAFTDGLPRAEGVTGELHPRGSMSLVNIAYASSLAWANPTSIDLEEQAKGPMFGTDPVELGLVDEADLLARIADDPTYDELFAAAFPDDADPRSLDSVTKAIASFERTIIAGRAPFDRWFFEGDESAISAAAKRGWDLFNFPGECTYCHFNFAWSDSTYFADLPERPLAFHNTGLYNLDGAGAYPPGNEGLMRYSGDPADMGRFKSPSLRNITETAPYMHDGSIDTLEGVLEHYARGGRASTPLADIRMRRFELDAVMVADFMAFFASLSDDGVLTDPTLSDPWTQP